MDIINGLQDVVNNVMNDHTGKTIVIIGTAGAISAAIAATTIAAIYYPVRAIQRFNANREIPHNQVKQDTPTVTVRRRGLCPEGDFDLNIGKEYWEKYRKGLKRKYGL